MLQGDALLKLIVYSLIISHPVSGPTYHALLPLDIINEDYKLKTYKTANELLLI